VAPHVSLDVCIIMSLREPFSIGLRHDIQSSMLTRFWTDK